MNKDQMNILVDNILLDMEQLGDNYQDRFMLLWSSLCELQARTMGISRDDAAEYLAVKQAAVSNDFVRH